jgi:IS5 family transposase
LILVIFLGNLMIGQPPNQGQTHMFLPNLSEFINPRHELCLLADGINWDDFELGFSRLYSAMGAPAKPVRLMVGLLLLKQIYGLSDESVMAEWVSNPYFQYFCGESVFQWKFPCDPSDLVHFRNRIGKDGVEKILAASILMHGDEVLAEDVSIDTTVQEKNITFPTDTKLAVKVIGKCVSIAKKEKIKLRQSYRFVLRGLLRTANSRSRNKAKQRASARRRIRTIAGRVLRDLVRKLEATENTKHDKILGICGRVLKQQRHDKDKIYSLHEPETGCIAKGKDHKKYEFGSKVSFAVAQKSNVILAAVSFKGNPNDNKTLVETIEQQERLTGVRPKKAFVDRGYKSRMIGTTKVQAPDNGKTRTKAEKKVVRRSFQRRAAIEPIIGHTKSSYGMGRNYLKGEIGDKINAMLAATAFNFKSWMRKAITQFFFVLKLVRELCRVPQTPIFRHTF